MTGKQVRTNYGRASVMGASDETRFGRKRLRFVPDPDSDGASVELYATDDRPLMDYVGRIDFVTGALFLEGRRPIPFGVFETQAECEAWVTRQWDAVTP